MDGGSANNRILALVKGTHPLIIVHPRPIVRKGTLYITTPPKVSDPFSIQSSELIFVDFENKPVEPKYDTYH